MKNLVLKWLSSFDFIYRLSLSLLANRIVHNGEQLTPEYLFSKGWVKDGDYFIEPNIKERDKIWIQFESYYYRVYHGEKKTFIALEKKKEWFEVYYLMAHGDNGRYELAGI